MNLFYAFIMGIIQGITEFLPVSSSGHLVLFSRLTGIEPSLTFDLALHVATALAVIIFCRKELFSVIKKPLSPLSIALAVATLVSAAMVFLLRGKAENAFSSSATLPLFFTITAALLLSSVLIRRKSLTSTPTVFQAIIVGAAQGLAVFPGLSRSGTTFFAGNSVGIENKSNASFCFLLSVPIIIGSAAVSAFEGSFSYVTPSYLAVGFFAAFISGLLSLKAIKSVFANKSLLPFVVYLCLLSAFLFLNDGILHLF